MATIHISEAEASRNLPALLARVRAGAEVIIQDHAAPAVSLRVLPEPFTRRLSESLRLARESASSATMDENFAADLEAAIASHREPLTPPGWD